MDNVLELKNKYYNYLNCVIPNLQNALNQATIAKNKILNITININKGYSVDGDRTIDNYLNELYTSVNLTYNTINSALSNAINRKNNLYYQWKAAEEANNK